MSERRGNRLLTDRIAFAHVKDKHPFEIDAAVILPDDCSASGPCRRTTLIFQFDVGYKGADYSRSIEKREWILKVAKNRAKRACGSVAFGNTSSATKTTLGDMSIRSIGIRSSIVGKMRDGLTLFELSWQRGTSNLSKKLGQ